MTEKSTILCIEDEEEMIELIGVILARHGYEVIGALGGQLGIEKVAQLKPDLVLLDLMMPVMDGFTFLDKYHHDSELERVPTVIATARTLSPSERKELLEVSERIIQKGAFSREKLLDSICQQVTLLVGQGAKP